MIDKSKKDYNLLTLLYLMLFLTPSIAMISGLFIAAWVATIMAIHVYLTGLNLNQVHKNFFLSERLLMLWAIISSIWSLSANTSLTTSSKLIITIVFCHIVRNNFHNLRIQRDVLIKGIYASFAMVILVYIIEKYSSGYISIAFRNVFQPYKEHYFLLYWLDRGSALFSLFSWVPIYLLISNRRPIFAIAVYIISLCILLSSDSDASILAFTVSGIVFLFSYFTNARFLILLPIGLIIYLFLMPIIAKIIDPEYIAATWGDVIPMSYIHRIFIWNYGVNEAMDSFFIGKGIDASKYLANEGAYTFLFKEVRMSFMPRHPHNNAIQIFLELGIVGSVLFSGYVWQIMSSFIKIYKKDKIYSSILISLFINYFIIGMVSFSIWQAWWLMIIVYLTLVLSFVRYEQNR